MTALKAICLRCRFASCRGRCVCVDGRDIDLHATAAECPKGRFPSDANGDVLPEPTAPAHSWEAKGPELWAELHRWALAADLARGGQWLAGFTVRIGCGECREHWRRWMKANPPVLTDHQQLFAWTVAAHNAVNQRLGKPEMAADAAWVRWGRVAF